MPELKIVDIRLIGLCVAVSLVAAACTSAGPSSSTVPVTKATAVAGPALADSQASSSGSTGDVTKGKAVFQANCARCHGQNAEGLVGPDLRHIASRRDRAFLLQWISDPPAVRPGTRMPKLNLSDSDLNAVVDYLLTLK